MIGTSLTFGFASAWVTSYINGVVMTEEHDSDLIGVMTAMMATVAGLAAAPLGYSPLYIFVGLTAGHAFASHRSIMLS